MVVIGVIAALTVAIIMPNVQQRVNSERDANIAQKVSKALDNMQSAGVLNVAYENTDAFVDVFEKYIKVAERCDADLIADSSKICYNDKVTAK